MIRLTATENGNSLVITTDAEGMSDLERMRDYGREPFGLDAAMQDVFEHFLANSEYDWIMPDEIIALTEAPILGIRDENDNVVKAWGFMDYMLHSPQEAILNTGKAVFTAAED